RQPRRCPGCWRVPSVRTRPDRSRVNPTHPALNPKRRPSCAIARLDHATWPVGGGGIGPAAFVTAWATTGAATKGYSPIDDAISRLAAVGTTTRPFMTAGFV